MMYSVSPEPMHLGSPHSSPVGSPFFGRQSSVTPSYAPSFLLGSQGPQKGSMNNMSGLDNMNSPMGVGGFGSQKTRDQLHVTWNPQLEQVRQMNAQQSAESTASSLSGTGPVPQSAPLRRIPVSGPPLKSLNSSTLTSPLKDVSFSLQSPPPNPRMTGFGPPTGVTNNSILQQSSLDISAAAKMSPNQTDPFLTQGTDFNPEEDMDPTWVTVFGFPKEATAYVLQQFAQYGTIETKEIPGNSNWMHIKYHSVLEARKALGKNTKVFADSIMVGVTPCIHKKTICHYRQEQNASQLVSPTADQSFTVRNLSNMMPPTSPPMNTSKVPTGIANASLNSSALSVTSPKRTGMRSLTAAYEQTANHYRVAPSPSSTPQKDAGVVSKAWDYIFG